MFHDRAFIYGPRGFKSVQTMMDYYKQEWLGNVAKQDDIYIVGDFCLGTDYDAIVDNVSKLLTDRNLYNKMSKATNPYGDGKACERIIRYIEINIYFIGSENIDI